MTPSEPHARRIPRDIEVTRDGSEAEVTMLTQGRGRYRVARVGREDDHACARRHQ